MNTHTDMDEAENFKSPARKSALDGPVLQEEAISYALANRWKIFPCKPGTKVPATPNGFKDASSEPDIINEWWSKNPDYNLAMCPEHAGLCVIDVDSAKDAFDQAAFDALNLPETYTVQTPSGGHHYYFKGTLPTSASKLATGIDTRGKGGYVLLPPSIVDGKQYKVVVDRTPVALPAEIAARLAKRTEATASADIELDQPVNVARARSLIIQRDVAVSGQGGNARTYQLACDLRDLGLSPEKSIELVMEPGGWNDHCVPPWSQAELETIFANASRYGQNSEGVYAVKPIDEVFADVIIAQEKIEPMTNSDEAKGWKPPSFEDYTKLFEEPDEPIEELVPGLIEKGIPTMLAGPGGVRKSWVAQQIGLSLQAGLPVFGRAVEQATFVYLSYEDKRKAVKRRAKAIQKQLSLPADSEAKYGDLTKRPGPAITVSDGGPKVEPLFYWLRDYLRAIPGHKFVVIDSTYNFIKFRGQTKIDEASVQEALSVLDELCDTTNSTILYLWHPSQAGQERGDASGWSVAWNNTPRARLSLSKQKDRNKKPTGMYVLKVEKRSNAPEAEPIYLAWQDGILAPVETANSLYPACCDVVELVASYGKAIKKTGNIEAWILYEIEKACGTRPSPKQIRAELDKAVASKRLRYIKGYGHVKAGYYPYATDPLTACAYPDYSIPNSYDANLDSPEDETEDEWIIKPKGKDACNDTYKH